MVVAHGVLVPTPPITPVEGGLLHIAEVMDITDPHEQQGVNYEADVTTVASGVDYIEGDCLTTNPKDFDDPFKYVESDEFTAYVGLKCNAAIRELNEYLVKAERNLEVTAGIALEEHVWTEVFAPNAEDLTPASGAVKAKRGLALLEEYAGKRYPGVPMVHSGRQAAVYLASEAIVSGEIDKAATVGGALFVNGGGYDAKTGPGGVVAGFDEAWLYVTGHVTIRRGAVEAHPVIEPGSNTAVALAEQIFVTTVEPFIGAVRVKLE